MPGPTESPSHQAQFHRRWGHLRDPHVRALAWLLDAPGLLDPCAPEWDGCVAVLGPASADVADWLADLDRAPEPLHATLKLQPFARLGRYAESLLAYYLQSTGRLVGHGVQVRAARNDTVGEFDFLLSTGESLLHWEFATKFYLLEAGTEGPLADHFVGPNLADTLGAKIRKIMERQLALSRHPAAQAVLPLPVSLAQALVKGWLFYPGNRPPPQAPSGIEAAHCRGFWCTLGELDRSDTPRYVVLSRLRWLAPARASVDAVLDRAGLESDLHQRHVAGADPAAPVMVALMREEGGEMLESARAFIVPDDWRERAQRWLTR